MTTHDSTKTGEFAPAHSSIAPRKFIPTRSFFIHTLGCKVNTAESEKLATELICFGWKAAKSAAEAALIIVNTCTVTGQADKKNRKTIRKLLKESSTAPILITGCAININADFYSELSKRVTCESNKELLVKRAEELALDGAHTNGGDDTSSAGSSSGDGTNDAGSNTSSDISGAVSRENDSANLTKANTQEEKIRTITAMRNEHILRTRANIKIQDGCNNACTFCIVHTARGPARSLPTKECLTQVQELINAKTAEVVLVGIDLGAWHEVSGAQHEGLDTCNAKQSAQKEHDLAWLVNELLKLDSNYRIRLSSLEPQNFSNALINAFSKHKGRLCRHAHLCLQSGSDKVLHEMARHYNSSDFLERVQHVRKLVPQIALSSDVIVGFPGETDEDFEQTCSLIEECQFMRLHVFRYSERPQTPAALRKDKVPTQTILKRAKHLEKLASKLSQKDKERRIGKEEFILTESEYSGTSESYHSTKFIQKVNAGKLIPACFIDIDETDGALIAEALE